MGIRMSLFSGILIHFRWQTGSSTIAASEERLLRRLPFYDPSPAHQNASKLLSDHGLVAYSSMVSLDNPRHALNTLSFLPAQPSTSSNSVPVLLHGYGAGLGFFYRNFPSLGSWVARSGTPLYAVDWLGMGRSTRPPFRIKANREDTIGRVTEAESFFVDSLEQWREKMGHRKMTLIGHSLGAYLTVAYTLRYPERVSRLILLSPAGVPQDPNMEVPSRDVDESPTFVNAEADPSVAKPASNKRVSRIRAEQKEAKNKESRTRRLFTYLWEEGWSPFQVVRSALFLGPLLVGKVPLTHGFTHRTPTGQSSTLLGGFLGLRRKRSVK
jgi:cardiolipin-specific phospholipase